MERAQVVATQAGDLPVLPEVAVKILALVRDPEASKVEIERLISRDGALSAKVLRIANSALFGLGGTVSTLSRALLLLGFNTLRNIVVAASTESLYRTKGSRFKEQMLWEHALGVAVASRRIAQEIRYVGMEEAFLAGLLHDIGKTVLDRNAGTKYQAVLDAVQGEGATFLDAERRTLGFDHAEVGALVIRKWNFAPALEEAVGLHHEAGRARIEPRLASCVSLGNAVCVRLGIGPEKRPDLDLAAFSSALSLGLDAATLERISTIVAEDLAAEKEMLGRS